MKLLVTGFFISLLERVDKLNILESRYSRQRGVAVPAAEGWQDQITNAPGPQAGLIGCMHSVVSCKNAFIRAKRRAAGKNIYHR